MQNGWGKFGVASESDLAGPNVRIFVLWWHNGGMADGRYPRWITWSVLPILFVAGALSMPLGDMAFICLKYGHNAYFAEGLRFIKHKPFTLSTGVVISENLATLAWLLSTVIWLALSIGAVGTLIGLSSFLRRVRVQATRA
jgi:hypothetical protein